MVKWERREHGGRTNGTQNQGAHCFLYQNPLSGTRTLGYWFCCNKEHNPMGVKQNLAVKSCVAIKISLFFNIATKLSLSESWVNIIHQVSDRPWEASKPQDKMTFYLTVQ